VPNLLDNHLESEIVLPLEDTPATAWQDLAAGSPKQEQIGRNGHAKRLFDPIFVSVDLMLSQSQTTLPFPDQKFYRPPSLIDANHLSGSRLGQIGHDEFVFSGSGYVLSC